MAFELEYFRYSDGETASTICYFRMSVRSGIYWCNSEGRIERVANSLQQTVREGITRCDADQVPTRIQVFIREWLEKLNHFHVAAIRVTQGRDPETGEVIRFSPSEAYFEFGVYDPLARRWTDVTEDLQKASLFEPADIEGDNPRVPKPAVWIWWPVNIRDKVSLASLPTDEDAEVRRGI